jgi:uncharacterized protein involved in exopolysaccharide biosynthesis
MSWTRRAVIIIAWLIVSVAAGVLIYWFLPKRYVSEAEVALHSEVLSSEGLAKFQKTTLTDSVDGELAAELLKSSPVLKHAVQAVGSLTEAEAKKRLKVKAESGSPIITLKASESSPERAQKLAAAVLEKAFEMDSARRQDRVKMALAAVSQRLTETQRELEALNTRILQVSVEKGVSFSSDTERQHSAGLTIADSEQKLAAVRVEEASLRGRLQQTTELIATFSTKGSLPTGFEFEDPEKNYSLTEARKRLLEGEGELASLRSRYGGQHPQIRATEAVVNSTKKTIMEMLNTQRDRLQTRLTESTSGIKIIEEKIAATESKTQKGDLALDPAYANLIAQREALQSSYTRLSDRLIELRVYADAKTSTFSLFAEPTLPERPTLQQLAAVLGISLVCGFFIGFCQCLLRTGPSAKEIATPAYANP